MQKIRKPNPHSTANKKTRIFGDSHMRKRKIANIVPCPKKYSTMPFFALPEYRWPNPIVKRVNNPAIHGFLGLSVNKHSFEFQKHNVGDNQQV
jgi:hypothetical protein